MQTPRAILLTLLLALTAPAPTGAQSGAAPAPYTGAIPGTGVAFRMIGIPGGEFLMGSPAGEAGRSAAEGPQVRVRVEPMWFGAHEVTWAEYEQFMKMCEVFERFADAGVRRVTPENQIDAVTAPSQLYDPSFTYEGGEDPRQPAVSMSQYAAKQYTKWLSLLTGDFYRLPTEAEWEYACRAGSTDPYAFGADPQQVAAHAWFYENSEERYGASPVGKKPPNAWGLHDMHGNAWEWTLDAFDKDHYAKLAAGAHSAQPLGVDAVFNKPTKLFPRVLRGGSWYDEDAALLRSAARLASDDDAWRSYDPNSPKSPWWFASEEGQTVGFRIVRPGVAPPRDQQEAFWRADVASIQQHADRRIDKEGRGERGLVDPSLPAAIQGQ